MASKPGNPDLSANGKLRMSLLFWWWVIINRTYRLPTLLRCLGRKIIRMRSTHHHTTEKNSKSPNESQHYFGKRGIPLCSDWSKSPRDSLAPVMRQQWGSPVLDEGACQPRVKWFIPPCHPWGPFHKVLRAYDTNLGKYKHNFSNASITWLNHLIR